MTAKRTKRLTAGVRRSQCPVAGTLDVLGDRWSLLVVRDLLRGKRRYAEFLDSSEGIPTNILAERLKRLAAHGIISQRRYSVHPPRMEYELTARGEDLRPVLRAMLDWGLEHVPGTRRPEPHSRNPQIPKSSNPQSLIPI